MRSRRIAYLCLQATTEGQASYAHVHEIINGLKAEGWDVDLFQPAYVGGPAPGPAGRLLEFKRVQRRLVKHLARYDAVYVRSHPLARLVSSAARRRGIPVVQECNGPYEDFFTAWPVARPFARRLLSSARRQYREADALIAVTPQLAEWLGEQTGRSDAVVVPNGANVDVFRPDAPAAHGLPERYAVFFGALAAWQGVSTLLDAAQDAEWPEEVRLVVVGDGAMRTDVEKAASDNPDRIRYLGALPYLDTASVVAGAAVSLIVKDMPQHARSGLSPLKLYESMACGVPVVVSDLPGLADTVKAAGCGVIVPPGDSSAVARAVAALGADDQGRRVFGEHGRDYAVEHASWASRARATAEVIETAIARHCSTTATR